MRLLKSTKMASTGCFFCFCFFLTQEVSQDLNKTSVVTGNSTIFFGLLCHSKQLVSIEKLPLKAVALPPMLQHCEPSTNYISEMKQWEATVTDSTCEKF